MSDTSTATAMSPMPPAQPAAPISDTDVVKAMVLRSSLAILGGVTAVVYATMKNHKGRFWWFIGGSLAGGAIGMAAGILMAKNATSAAPAANTASNFVNDYRPQSSFRSASFGNGGGRGEASGLGNTSVV